MTDTAPVAGPLGSLLERLNTESVGEAIHVDVARKLVTDAFLAGIKAGLFDGSFEDVTWDTGWVQRRGRRVTLAHKQYRIFEVLAERFGTPVSREDLLTRVWADDTAVELNTVEVHASILRRALKPIGIDVANQRGLGYRLRLIGNGS